MKRLIVFAAAIAMVAANAAAQTLRVWDHAGSTAWIYDANTLLNPMSFEGNAITISGFKHEASNGVWMTVDNSEFQADIVANPNVVYITGGDDPGVHVYAAGELAPYLTVRNDAECCNVDITVADALQRELTFVLRGSAQTVAIHGNYKTTVVLDGIELWANNTAMRPALWIDNGKRIELQVKGQNSFKDAATNEKKAALYVKGHAEWKGDGTVSIAGAQRHAYASGEYTQFKKSFTGTFNVTSAGSDGMHVEQYLEINGGTFNIAGNKGDGIDVSYVYADKAETTPTDDEFNGQFIMNGGTITVAATEAATKGVKCDDKMTITAGRINATAQADGTRGISAGTDLYLGTEDGTDATAAHLYLTANGGEYTDPETDDVDKCRGLKVKRDFYHYPSTVERDATSVVKAKKIVDVDGTYYALGGVLSGITIE